VSDQDSRAKRVFLNFALAQVPQIKEEQMEIDEGLIDKLLADYKNPEDLIGEQDLLKELTHALVERCMPS
jgi:hypothetical protein